MALGFRFRFRLFNACRLIHSSTTNSLRSIPSGFFFIISGLEGHEKTRFFGLISLVLRSSSRRFSGISMEETEGLRNAVEMASSVSDKHLLRPSARYYSGSKDASDHQRGKYTLIRDAEDSQQGIYDKPLPCFGCGIGWFSFLLGFACPLLWYYATFLYFGNCYRKDPRERAGLAASAIAAMVCSAVLLIIIAFVMFTR